MKGGEPVLLKGKLQTFPVKGQRVNIWQLLSSVFAAWKYPHPVRKGLSSAVFQSNFISGHRTLNSIYLCHEAGLFFEFGVFSQSFWNVKKHAEFAGSVESPVEPIGHSWLMSALEHMFSNLRSPGGAGEAKPLIPESHLQKLWFNLVWGKVWTSGLSHVLQVILLGSKICELLFYNIF